LGTSRQFVLENDVANLPRLVRFGFVALGLQVQNFGDVFAGEYMMAAGLVGSLAVPLGRGGAVS
jgi:hypothetical protein